jgi:hypothetical protein
MITKTDFLNFLKTPRHLWATKHGQIEKAPSPIDQHRMKQGKEIEGLAREYLQEYLLQGTGTQYTRYTQ